MNLVKKSVKKLMEKLVPEYSKFRENEIALKKANKKIRKLNSKNVDHIKDMMDYAWNSNLKVNTIIDVGVNTGTDGLYDHYKDVQYILVDPLKESEFFMRAICSTLKNSSFSLCALGKEKGVANICVPASMGGTVLTSINVHNEKTLNTEIREVSLETLDNLVKEKKAKGPFILKIDVEGAELEVLKGATNVLKHTEMLIMETRLRPVMNSPQIFEVLEFLKSNGHVLFNVFDRNYSAEYGYLRQFDIVSVKENGHFRSETKYYNFPRSEKINGEKSLHIKHKGKIQKREIIAQQILKERPYLKEFYLR